VINQTYTPQQIQQNGWDPLAMAEWMAYYEQLDLWQIYVEEVVLNREIDSYVGDISFPDLDHTGVKEAIEGIHDSALKAAEEETKALTQKAIDLVTRLEERKNRRITYWDWRRDQQDLFLEYAERWLRQSEGLEINIDGNIYLISSQPIERAPRNVVPIVTSKLTPYDIFNDDGTLKRSPR
jgi:hypothetical protein